MADVNITVDGKKIVQPAGTLLIEAVLVQPEMEKRRSLLV